MLSDNAMLVTLSVSLYEGRKLDKVITAEVEHNHNAKNAGNYTKKLVEKSFIDSYKKLANEARILLYKETLPWDNNGYRLLSVKAYNELNEKLFDIKSKFETAVNNFIDQYPDIIADAKQRLNGMFNFSDYPTSSELQRKFNFDIRYFPLLNVNDIRLNIQADEENKIKAQIENNYKIQFNDAIAELWSNLHETIKKLAETMQDKDKQFKESTLKNVESLVNFLDKYNFDSDKRIDEIKELISKNLVGYDAENLRQDNIERKNLANKANEVLNKIESYL
jgi:hypothetical protein